MGGECGADMSHTDHMDSELVFEMDDVKSSSLSKSIESLQNLSMSSEDPEATLQDRDLMIHEMDRGEDSHYSIEHTDSQVSVVHPLTTA